MNRRPHLLTPTSRSSLATTLAILSLAATTVLAAPPTKTTPKKPVSKSPASIVIEGVQPASLDQPRAQLEFRRSPTGPVIAPPQPNAKPTADSNAKPTRNGNRNTARNAPTPPTPAPKDDAAALLKSLGMGDLTESANTITAFLDTGASGLLLSQTAARTLGIQPVQGATFEDVGVGGSEEFSVSEPLHATILLPDGSKIPANAPTSPLRAQIARQTSEIESTMGASLNVAGMPLLNGRVLQLDPGPVDNLTGTLGVQFLPAAPQSQFTIKLTPMSFKRFTRTTPPSAAPNLVDNPMIANVAVTHNGKSTTGAFLLDTGAAASMISSSLATKLGIGDNPTPEFSLTVGGIGGQTKSPGIYFDSLSLPGGPTYKKAPLLIKDITLVDPLTKETKTLDGVFGMNFLAGSASISDGGGMPNLGDVKPSPYKLIIIDLKNNTLGLSLK